eukprot:SM000053S17497  [mRNA]  locus=s53:631361:632783:- [translate_table: standard]
MDHSVVTSEEPQIRQTSCRKTIPLAKAGGRSESTASTQMQGVGHGPLKGDGQLHTIYLSPRASGVEVTRLTAPVGHSAPRKPGQQVEPLGPESPVHVHGQRYELICMRGWSACLAAFLRAGFAAAWPAREAESPGLERSTILGWPLPAGDEFIPLAVNMHGASGRATSSGSHPRGSLRAQPAVPPLSLALDIASTFFRVPVARPIGHGLRDALCAAGELSRLDSRRWLASSGLLCASLSRLSDLRLLTRIWPLRTLPVFGVADQSPSPHCESHFSLSPSSDPWPTPCTCVPAHLPLPPLGEPRSFFVPAVLSLQPLAFVRGIAFRQLVFRI